MQLYIFPFILLVFDARADLVGEAPTCDDKENRNCEWAQRAEMLEYTANANPPMAEVPVRIFPASLHKSGPTRTIPLDLSEALAIPYPATAPNLLASFLRINAGDSLETSVEHATSQSLYVIRGSGSSVTRAGVIDWHAGDLFVLPYLGDATPSVCNSSGAKNQCVKHSCGGFLQPSSPPNSGGALEEAGGGDGSCALYYVHDEPLLRYLGARPVDERRFQPALYPGAAMRQSVADIDPVDAATGQIRNRRGILLSNPDAPQTKTLTPTLWSLLNSIDAGATQSPHRHNSVALDLAVASGATAAGRRAYTLLGRELDANGHILDPVKVEWEDGAVFVTPPGWWHSHHNPGSDTAWVLPMQDAGLYTHQRTLDIRFVEEEAARLKSGVNRGATLGVQPSSEEGKEPSGVTDDKDEKGSRNGDGAPPLVAGTIMFGHNNPNAN
mmetsp:Transcript_8333/g.15291  ORF Transcript_8333/g.15291 Transcript_8333/m.15291 type:complete len:441 (+) Transcript_8333:91-1413(+)